MDFSEGLARTSWRVWDFGEGGSRTARKREVKARRLGGRRETVFQSEVQISENIAALHLIPSPELIYTGLRSEILHLLASLADLDTSVGGRLTLFSAGSKCEKFGSAGQEGSKQSPGW